jgi:hypothetical protein
LWTRNEKYILGIDVLVDVSFMYPLHPLDCLMVTGIRIILAIQTLRVGKVFKQDGSRVKFVVSEISQSRLE